MGVIATGAVCDECVEDGGWGGGGWYELAIAGEGFCLKYGCSCCGGIEAGANCCMSGGGDRI